MQADLYRNLTSLLCAHHKQTPPLVDITNQANVSFSLEQGYLNDSPVVTIFILDECRSWDALLLQNNTEVTETAAWLLLRWIFLTIIYDSLLGIADTNR